MTVATVRPRIGFDPAEGPNNSGCRGRTRTNEDELEDELGKKRFRAINIDAGATPSDEIDGTCYEQVMSSVWQT